MKSPPPEHLRSARLVYRPPAPTDAKAVAKLAGAWDVARMTGSIPFPYSEADAAAWLAPRAQGREAATDYVWAIERQETPGIIGMVGLHLRGDSPWELGYWLGEPFWGRGYATEAARMAVAAADASRISLLMASHFDDNPASGAVLAKVGFSPTGEIVPRPCLARKTDVLAVMFERRAPGMVFGFRLPSWA
jgi:Acetyltransferases, including N-acetylases of ribosomal proteins